MPSARLRLVVFRTSAGPRRGFGHLVRCTALAEALGAPALLSLDGPASARRAAVRLGWTLTDADRRDLAELDPDLVVVDHPRAADAAAWVTWARARRLPVASVHDRGIGRVASDLTIDGSLAAAPGWRATLQGPRYAVLGGTVRAWRRLPSARVAGHVVVTLGGGQHVRRLGAAIARRIHAAAPAAQVLVVTGFAPAGARPVLPSGAHWVHAPEGLAPLLSRAAVAVVAGGLTLQEACALGTPAVALAVVPAQRPAIRAWARAGAILDAGSRGRVDTGRTAARVAALVAALLADPARAAALGRCGRRGIDGEGVVRVAARLRALALRHRRSASSGEVAHAA